MDNAFIKKLFDSAATAYFEKMPCSQWSLSGFLMSVKEFWSTSGLSRELLGTMKKRYLMIINDIVNDQDKDKDQRSKHGGFSYTRGLKIFPFLMWVKSLRATDLLLERMIFI
ncbi:hypothetical protein BC937DRAFT_92424 [Endogone sp. FLAS-F59071]|nr:hypothetical protein BC937DRAFT_92424 [Endogone sp. FLAS-F59071]|eukprot:RUS15450.1 hypothetical protein BC937DRAFT_92424 [Endogone sp. FLAS-F59071]